MRLELPPLLPVMDRRRARRRLDAAADTYATPFASTANVTFTEQPPWTKDISHGEMIRDGYDQHLSSTPATCSTSTRASTPR